MHLFLIDPLSKLNLKKDSSLLMALSFKNQGEEVYFLFPEDFYWRNDQKIIFKVYDFVGTKKPDHYLEMLRLEESLDVEVNSETVIHMRLDPPFDSRYQRVLWLLELLQKQYKTQVVNNPLGIMKWNEKLTAYETYPQSLKSFVGESWIGASHFIQSLKQEGHEFLILKPLDLFQGYGVEKVAITDPTLQEIFKRKTTESNGAIVIQPFHTKISEGEIRSLFFKGLELGTILKRPKEGEFLANIAQGASFIPYSLSPLVKKSCEQICHQLSMDGVDFVAFDIMGELISEVNITCPGLLVEVSKAHERNLALDIWRLSTQGQ